MSTLRLTTIANQGGTSSVPSDTVISGSAKAWVNFNGTGTVAIRAAFNVSSITDNGTGNYTVNFSTAMVDANYSAISTCGQLTGGASDAFPLIITQAVGTFQISIVRAAYSDAALVNVAIFR